MVAGCQEEDALPPSLPLSLHLSTSLPLLSEAHSARCRPAGAHVLLLPLRSLPPGLPRHPDVGHQEEKIHRRGGFLFAGESQRLFPGKKTELNSETHSTVMQRFFQKRKNLISFSRISFPTGFLALISLSLSVSRSPADQRSRDLRDPGENQGVPGAHAVPAAAHHRVVPAAAAEPAAETVSGRASVAPR